MIPAKDVAGPTALMTAAQAPAPGPAINEFLTFKLGDEEYGIDILCVQEIRSYEPPTHVANAPEFVKGMINLRGVIVPVFDMRIKFNLARVAYDAFTVVIVLRIAQQVVAIVVDGVSDVITFTPEQLRAVPEFAATIGSDYLLALGALEKRTLMLLDIKKLMGSIGMGVAPETLH